MLRLRTLSRALAALFLGLIHAPAAHAASGSVPLPEPSALLLLALGVAGVAIGRQFSSKRPRD